MREIIIYLLLWMMALLILVEGLFVSKIYESTCDIYLKSVKEENIISTTKDISVAECLPKCVEASNCYSVDFAKNGTSTECVLLKLRFVSNCKYNTNIMHFVTVS